MYDNSQDVNAYPFGSESETTMAKVQREVLAAESQLKKLKSGLSQFDDLESRIVSTF